MIVNRLQSKTSSAADAHWMLQNPERIADVFGDADLTMATQLVEQLIANLSTPPQVDGAGVIYQLIFVCAADRPVQSAMRNFSRVVAALVADCVRFVDDDDTEIITEFVMSVPLLYGFDVLCRLGAAYGLVRATFDSSVAGSDRYMDDINAIEHAIEIWRERARRAIASGNFMEEGDLLVLLDGLAHLGVGAKDADALAALGEFCSNVPGGFAYFLERTRGGPAAA